MLDRMPTITERRDAGPGAGTGIGSAILDALSESAGQDTSASASDAAGVATVHSGREGGRETGHAAWAAATLPTVSRTFALNIRVLPGRLRRTVTTAYLLFRLADTVEDTPDVPESARSGLFEAMLDRLAGPPSSASGGGHREGAAERAAWDLLAAGAAHDGERALVRQRALLWDETDTLPPGDRAAVARYLGESIRGMMSAPRGRADPAAPECLATADDLRRYCWHVAGTVGAMLTELFLGNEPLLQPATDPTAAADLRGDSEAFGRALQLVNILQDVAGDVAEGRCYLPAEWLAEEGLRPGQLLEKGRRAAGLRVLRRVAAWASADLDAALRYTLRIPRGAVRLRVFCLWPLMAALRTLGKVVRGVDALVPGRRPKILRRVLYQDMAAAVGLAPSRRAVRSYVALIRRSEFPPGWPAGAGR